MSVNILNYSIHQKNLHILNKQGKCIINFKYDIFMWCDLWIRQNKREPLDTTFSKFIEKIWDPRVETVKMFMFQYLFWESSFLRAVF